MMADAKLEHPVWSAPLEWRWRYRLFRRGGRRVREGWASYDDLSPELADLGVEVVRHRIDVKQFWDYVEEVSYRRMSYWGGGNARAATEKWLEHHVSIELMQPQPGETFVDVASCYSPFPDILRERLGCTTYRQDWEYPAGVHGDCIGSDAAAIPLPDGSVDGLTLHCSFEHFEEDRDRRFLMEAGRLLRPGGRLCILPIYTNRRYLVQTDLAQWQHRAPSFERDAIVCLSEGWGEVHGRFYDVAHFASRVLGSCAPLRLRLYRVENYLDVAPDCYLKFAAVFRRERAHDVP